MKEKKQKSIYIILIIIGILIIGLVLLSHNLKLKENMASSNIQVEFESFVDNVCKAGKITREDYNNLMSKLSSSGESYELSIEIQQLDEDVSKKINKEDTAIGENIYYKTYTEQMLNSLNNTGVYSLNEGDVIQLKIVKSESKEIVAQRAGTIIVNGN